MNLIAIIPFYNFSKSSIFVENHLRMIDNLERQKVPHFTIEVGYKGEYSLPNSENTLQLPTNSILWHKESLINLGVDLMKDQYPYVAWIDSGLLLDNGWAEKTLEKLEECDIIQCFSEGIYWKKDQTIQRTCLSQAKNGPLVGGISPGGAIASHVRLFDLVALYDKCVVGGGDAIFMESFFNPRYIVGAEKLEEDTKKWTNEIQSHNFRLGYIEGNFYHLWHGEIKNRQYRRRHEILKKYDFDPNSDVILKDGILEWNTNKYEMHQEISDYMDVRFLIEPIPYEKPKRIVVPKQTKRVTKQTVSERLNTMSAYDRSKLSCQHLFKSLSVSDKMHINKNRRIK